jgi:hypothetical protein
MPKKIPPSVNEQAAAKAMLDRILDGVGARVRQGLIDCTPDAPAETIDNAVAHGRRACMDMMLLADASPGLAIAQFEIQANIYMVNMYNDSEEEEEEAEDDTPTQPNVPANVVRGE